MSETCEICNKTFKNALALAGHKRMHGPSKGVSKRDKTLVNCKFCNELFHISSLEKHQNSCYLNPSKIKHCLYCNKVLSKKHSTKFCNQSCAGFFNNKKRKDNNWSRSEESRNKTRESLLKYYDSNKTIKKIKKNKRKKSSILSELKMFEGPHTKIFKTRCKHCNKVTYQRQKKRYCVEHAHLYKSNNRNRYKFTFNVYHYPELFDLDLLNKVGWFSPGGKAGKWNVNGLSRDHKVSVNEAIKNRYDPYYITHPLNCELIPHAKNNSKKTKSSITYNELVKVVDEFDLLR